MAGVVQVEVWDFQVDVLFGWLTFEEALMVDGCSCRSYPTMLSWALPHLYSAGIRPPWRRRGAGQRTEFLWGKLLAAEEASRTGDRGHWRMPRSGTAGEVRNIRIPRRVQCIEQKRTHHIASGNLHSEMFTVEFELKRAAQSHFDVCAAAVGARLDGTIRIIVFAKPYHVAAMYWLQQPQKRHLSYSTLSRG